MNNIQRSIFAIVGSLYKCTTILCTDMEHIKCRILNYKWHFVSGLAVFLIHYFFKENRVLILPLHNYLTFVCLQNKFNNILPQV